MIKLEKSINKLNKRLFTVEEYYKLAEVGILLPSDRVELVQGEIIKMSPINSHHAEIVDKLAEKLIVDLHGKVIVRIQNPVQIDSVNEPEPDIVVTKYKDERYGDRHPIPEEIYLIVEVSDSSLLFDQEVKYELYANAGIKEYWIINIKNKVIEVYKNPRNGYYASKVIYEIGDIITCKAINVSFEVGQILKF